MEITDKLLDRLAALSRLNIEADEREQVKTELEQILSYMGQIEGLKLGEELPLTPVGQKALREDTVRPSLPRREALKNAPETDGTYWLVPKTVE